MPSSVPRLSPALTPAQQAGWQEDAAQLAGDSITDDEREALAAILAASPHLSRATVQFAADLPVVMSDNWTEVLELARQNWKASWQTASTDAQMMVAVRRYRYRAHFAIALAELFGRTTMEASWALLTKVAEDALTGGVEYLLKDQPATGSGWVILGLGKLGEGELNYSSDIDLIALQDSRVSTLATAQSPEQSNKSFSDLTRRLSTLLSQQTEEGFGWRVDFRLRPDPAVTPLCLSVEAAITYYESIARTWERAAFIRARPVAGDLAVGEHFLAHISAFVWRRNLDYTVLDDLQIWLRHLPTPADYLGFDVKLGAFGIRHVELLVHLLQLLGGGRHNDLRQHYTFAALDALTKEGWLARDQIEQMKQCYSHWRFIEHRLQYLRDTQTHSLPRNEQEMTSFAAFLGLSDASALRERLAALQQMTQAACSHPLMDRLLAGHKAEAGQTDRLLASSADRTVNSQWLADIGFTRPDDMMDIIDGWMSGRIPATRSERARDYLARFLPPFLARLGKASAPDSAFACFTELIRNLPAGAQIFALFVHYPQIADLVGNVLVKAPAMTRQLSRKPALFDLLLETEFFTPFEAEPLQGPPGLADVARRDGPEQALDQLCLWASEARFRVDVHFLQGLCSPEEASKRLSDIGDICIGEVIQMAWLDMQRRYGHLPDEMFAVLGLGRLGSQRLTSASDLDLMFVYQSTADAASDGRQALSAGQYYNRLAQLVISWLSVQTAQGKLFDIDTRLRPDGQSGALATRLERLASYYDKEAWPWEYCAFLKARLIYADPDLTAVAEQVIRQIKSTPPALPELAADIITMRQRLASEAASLASLKKRPGGFLDAEFLAVLLAVQRSDTVLLLRPDGCPLTWLEKTQQTAEPPEGLSDVCAGLAELELITQFTSLCIGKALSAVAQSDSTQTWLALAERLELTTADRLDERVAENCARIEVVLEKYLGKTVAKPS